MLRLPSGTCPGNRTCLLLIAPPPIAGAPANSVRLFIEFVYPVTLGQASRTCAMLALRSSADRLFPGRSLMASLLIQCTRRMALPFKDKEGACVSTYRPPLRFSLFRKEVFYVCLLSDDEISLFRLVCQLVSEVRMCDSNQGFCSFC